MIANLDPDFLQGTANEATLNIRVPFWSLSDGVKASINAENLPSPIPGLGIKIIRITLLKSFQHFSFAILFEPPAGSFLSVTRKWNSGDKLSLELPLTLRLEHIQGKYSPHIFNDRNENLTALLT